MRPHNSHNPFASNQAMLAQGAIAPKLTMRPVAAVLGWTEAQKAAWCVQRDTACLAAAEAAYAEACRQLGRANCLKSMRRHWVAQAFRAINARRSALSRARKALAASTAAQAAPSAIGRQHALPLG